MGAALAALIVTGGCGVASSTTGTTPTTPTTATESSVPPSPHVVRLSEGAEGQTIQVSRGEGIVLTLHNTYWRIAAPEGGVLTQIGTQQDSPAPAGTCLAGVGCGTVQARFVAAAPGSVMLTASRTSCGEAMACGPGEGSYAVHLVVS